MTSDAEARLVSGLAEKVVAEVERAIVGKHQLLRKIMATVLADGHVLLEDYPGLGKTLMSKSFAHSLGLSFRRIQFTPDLLPADITGSYVLNPSSGEFEMRKGPIFAHTLLADEINRASPKTQSALLEAMQERQVTIEGETYVLERPFVVIATQNPIEYEGTFPLPEAQLDRFLIRLNVGYPTQGEEQEILSRRREQATDDLAIDQVANRDEIERARQQVEQVHIDPDVEAYIVQLVGATRQDGRVAVGASPRGSLALMKLSRAWAAMDGRGYVLPDDVKSLAKAALIHRLILQPEYWMQRRAPEDVLEAALASVPVPVLDNL